MATTNITVNDVNRCPTANAGGPYSGVVNLPVSFNGTGSSDPDADALTYSWDFGDPNDPTGSSSPTPQHTYSAVGDYTVSLLVSDGQCSDTTSTTAHIVDVFEATAFQLGGNKNLRLGSGRPTWCTQIEPVDHSFDVSNVILSSIRMINMSAYPGSVPEILTSGKTAIDGDKNGDGVLEITACFSKTDLRALFSGLPGGKQTVPVRFEGDLASGGRFQADVDITVFGTGGALAASITPNPFNPEAVLTFATSKPGAVRVDMFDLQGRLVRTLMDEPNATAGYHDVRIKGLGLGSGVYFVRTATQFDGTVTTKALIAK
jgi:PKD repeat protein